MISLSGGICILGALSLLLLPLRWWFSALAAALVHELCHLTVLTLFHGRVHRIHIGIGGAVIDAHLDNRIGAFFSIAAGPLGSFSLLLLRKTCPELAVCGLVQGCFNLLPVFPMDGGRLLGIILECFCPRQAASIARGITCKLLAILLLLVFKWGSMEDILLFWAAVFLLYRKSPCKQSEIGLQ